MSLIKKIKRFGQYSALAIGLGISAAAPVKATEPITPHTPPSEQLPSHRLELNLELKSLEDKVLDYNKSEFIDLKEHSGEGSMLDLENIFLIVPVNLATGYLTKLLWHETAGHALTAKYFGCTDIKLTSPASMSYVHPPDITNLEENLISAAGTEATTSLGLVLYEVLKHDQIPKSMKPWVAAFSLLASIDRHQYIAGSAFLNYARIKSHPGNDFYNIMAKAFEEPELEGFYVLNEGGYWIENSCPADSLYLCGVYVNGGDILRIDKNGRPYKFRPYADKEGSFRKYLDKNRYFNVRMENLRKGGIVIYPELQKKLDIAYGLTLGMSVLELSLRWNEISYLIGTALGKDLKAPEGIEVLKTGFYPIPDGFLISIDGVF